MKMPKESTKPEFKTEFRSQNSGVRRKLLAISTQRSAFEKMLKADR